MSIWPEIKKAVNTDIGTPLNHLTWLNDYKLFGEDSYVFKNTNILHELYKDYELCMNDNDISEETFAFVLENDNEVGKALSKVHGIESANIIKTLNTMNVVANSEIAMRALSNVPTAMKAIFNNATAMNVVVNSETAMNVIANSETAMNVIFNNATAMNVVANSETAMNVVANSETAMNVIANSETAMNAVANSEIAMNVVANSETAMRALSNVPTAMKAIFNNATAMNVVVNSETAMNVVANSEIAMNVVANSETAMNIVINNSTAMNAVCLSSIAIGKFIVGLAGLNPAKYADMNAVANSETAMNAITSTPIAIITIAKNIVDWSIMKSFIISLNAVSTYIKNVYNILTNKNYFTSKISKFADSTSSLNTYGTASYAANGFIACVLGAYTYNRGYGTRLKINGEVIKEAIYPNNTPVSHNSVNSDNVNAIAIPTATFEDIQDGYAAIAVYIAV